MRCTNSWRMATTTFDDFHGRTHHVGHHPKLATALHHATVAIAGLMLALTLFAIALWIASLLRIGRIDPPPPARRVEVRALQSERSCPSCDPRTIISYAP